MFLPSYIYTATNRYNRKATAGANSTLMPKRKKKEQKRENKADIGGSTKNKDDSQPLRPPENYHHAPSTPQRLIPSNTSKKGATTTTLLPGQFLGFPLVCSEVGRRYPTPFKKDGDTRRRHRVSAESAGISPELQNHTSRRSV